MTSEEKQSLSVLDDTKSVFDGLLEILIPDKKQTILVVDDTEINIDVLLEILSDDYTVRVATDGESALDKVKQFLPDLILLDIMMPGLSGFDVCRQLKTNRNTQGIPVIFITSLTGAPCEIHGLEQGAADYITKPFNPDIVRLRVKNHLELKRYRDNQTRLALSDGLTGIPNRRAFDEQLHREWSRALRSHALLSLIMIDIDHFKSYNDTYGHLGGDDCLKQVAAALLASMRASDFVARFGGEEFVCIPNESDATGALITAERIRTKVESLFIPHEASPVSPYVTISLGTVTLIPSEDVAPDYLIKTADQMLYMAKDKGRNRIEQWIMI